MTGEALEALEGFGAKSEVDGSAIMPGASRSSDSSSAAITNDSRALAVRA